ncbi:3-phosphoshikimate 1-carboxyvinyltransferase [bacterium]|nr:3-phosphoshikimate 1-carboxyvinyltransferase [bacterium]NIN93074.1 3-phosphoshikimate 1-carboxyvinyltransferase [bacterium]NIO18943.1 3-phosphoshikimate 1-carboxyvinyltransferase [bacterium]NIO74024.1 3-phosphoshikimate 1-carboxyvinyltransferase [bacterium]
MRNIKVKRKELIKGEISLPGDKSISHRAIMMGSIARGETRVKGLSDCVDCQNTLNAFLKLGIEIEEGYEGELTIHGRGLKGLSSVREVIDVGNSGTTMRLLSGILAGQDFSCTITGDESLKKRPMKRIILPLREMGAKISSPDDNHPPITIVGQKLHPIDYLSPVASAQVKSCVLLAGLYAQGRTSLTEPSLSRDHTERMLRYLGAPIETKGRTIFIEGVTELGAKPITVPGDISSAAFFIIACLLLQNSQIRIKGVGVNPTRTGILDILKNMGAEIVIENVRELCGEPVADLVVNSSSLAGVEIGGELIPRIIDEIPVLAVAATQAEGVTEISDARELRVKESDRIGNVVSQLSRMGALIEEKEDGMVISGGKRLVGTSVNSYGDHRMAMALTIAGLIADGETTINDVACINTSFPHFIDILNKMVQ